MRSVCLASFLALCLVSSSVASPQGAQPSNDLLLGQGIALLAQGKYEGAIEALDRYKQQSPLDARPYFYAGMALAQENQLSAAASELKEAVFLAPDQLEYHVFLANLYSRLKRTTEVRATLSVFDRKGATEQLPSSWLHLLADVYFRLEQPRKSLDVLNILSARSPDDARTNYELGRVYGYMNNQDLAIQFYQKSIQESPRNPDAYFEMGKAYFQHDEMPAAKEAFLEAWRQEKTNPEFILKLADTCLALREPQEAIGYLKVAETSAASYPEIYYALGRAYEGVGDRSAGDRYMRKYKEVSMARLAEKEKVIAVDRLVLRGEDALSAGKKAEAQSLFEQAVKADPRRWEAQGYLAEIYLASGALKQAYEHLAWMEKVLPDSVVGNYLMAQYWYRAKDDRQALFYAQKAEIVRPGNSELRKLLGKIYMGLGEKDKAMMEYKEAERLASNRIKVRQDLEQLKTPKAEVSPAGSQH